MHSQKLLFPLALLYLLSRRVANLQRRRRPPARTNCDGDAEGCLVHRYINVARTPTGIPTDVTFHVVEAPLAGGECVVFLHGFLDTWQLWSSQLAHLAGRYRLLAVDLKGSGQSSMRYPNRLFPEIARAGGDYSLEMQADELIAALNRLGVRRFTLVTLDLGTIIGDILAGRCPDRIQRYMRCQQPLVGHFRASIPQGRILRTQRGARRLTALLEAAPDALLRILYGRTGWPALDRGMRRSKDPMPETLLETAIAAASHPFRDGPRAGRPGVFACAWAGLYQDNRDYLAYLRANLQAYRRYNFPVLLVQGVHDLAMPAYRFDGSTGMALKTVLRRRHRQDFGAEHLVLSRPFFADGRGLGDGYLPWDGLIAGCTRPLHAAEFFPNAPRVALRFVDAGHFLPLEAPAAFNDLLSAFLADGTPPEPVGTAGGARLPASCRGA